MGRNKKDSVEKWKISITRAEMDNIKTKTGNCIFIKTNVTTWDQVKTKTHETRENLKTNIESWLAIQNKIDEHGGG